MQRVNGVGRVGFAYSNGQTRLSDLYQSGAAKIRLPKVYDQAATAVLINTAGGLTGGDRLSLSARVGAGAHAIVTTQTAERAYRSLGTSAEMTSTLTVADGGLLEWLPQEAILFDHSNIQRTVRADLTGNARLLMCEGFVLGRAAMGETLTKLTFKDSWRISRDGRLVFADDVRLDDDPAASMLGKATGGGGLAVATVLDCRLDAEDHIAHARASLAPCGTSDVAAAASAWNGVLLVRMVGRSGHALRKTLTTFLTHYRAAQLPRVWSC
ncbi:urease accessory protein UreD [Roseibium denhamense]|nr:urease accessory protein UreD [Roseibium denhamense]